MPSARYLGLIVEGAREAKLNPEYIEKVASHAVYKATQELKDKRALLPTPETLKKITTAELAELNEKDEKNWIIAVCGYVMRLKNTNKEKSPDGYGVIPHYRGKENTRRVLTWLAGKDTSADPKIGEAPFPDVDTLTADQKEYVMQWVDHWWTHHCENDQDCILGFIADWD